MSTHIKYVMSGVINSPPYDKITWAVWDTPDFTGTYSGYSGLIDIQVEYQVTDNVTSSGITGVGAQPVIPDPPTPLTIKIGYVMKATLVASPHTLITWKVWDSPDYTGASSGYAASEIENICVDYTEIDDVNRGPQAVPQINELVGPAGGDLTGSYPNPLVVGINGDPIDTTGLASGYMLIFNGTSWIVQPVGSGTFAAGGDLTGTDINQTVIGLRTKSLNSSLASIGASQDGYILTWDNGSSSWKALPNAGGTLAGDVTGAASANTLTNIQGNPVSASGAITTGYILTWNGSAWVPAVNIGGTLSGDVIGPSSSTTVEKLRNKDLNTNIGTVTSAQDGYAVIWDNSSSSYKVSRLFGDVVGTVLANTVTKLQGYAVSSTAPTSGQALLWDGSAWTPNTNSPSGTAGGDLSGSYPNPTVTGLQSYALPAPTLPNTFLTFDGSFLGWVGIGGSGVTWADDLVGSTDTDQWIAAISGPAGAGTTVDVSAPLYWISGYTGSAVTANIGQSGTGRKDFFIESQRNTGSAFSGNIILNAAVTTRPYNGVIVGVTGNTTTITGDWTTDYTYRTATSTDAIFAVGTYDAATKAYISINGYGTSGGAGTEWSSGSFLTDGYFSFKERYPIGNNGANGGSLTVISQPGQGVITANPGAGGDLYLSSGMQGQIGGVDPIPGLTNAGDVIFQIGKINIADLSYTGSGTSLAFSAVSGISGSGVTISQDASTTGNGGDFTIASQPGATGGNSGNLILKAAITPSGLNGNIQFNVANAVQARFYQAQLAFDSAAGAPILTQESTSSGSASNMSIIAQGATGASNNGGHLTLAAGTSGSATAGSVFLQTAGSTRITLNATGAVRFHTYGTGLIHSDSSGNLTSSTLVNADVSSSAAIDVSKLAAGTSAQILLNNSTPTPTWTTVSGDATISSSGSVTNVGIRGKTLASSLASVGASQDGYVLTWVNGSSDWEAKPSAGGSSVTWAGDLNGSTSSSQKVVVLQNLTVSSAKTANYTITTSDYIVIIGTLTSSITITLPASPTTGQSYIIKNGNNMQFVRNTAGTITTVGYTVTVTPSSGNIDGLSSFVINQPYMSLHVVYNGSEWSIV